METLGRIQRLGFVRFGHALRVQELGLAAGQRLETGFSTLSFLGFTLTLKNLPFQGSLL